MDKLDFLDAPTGAEPALAPVVDAAPEPTPEPTDGPARGPDGKFAPRTEAAPEPQAEQPPEPPQAQQPPPGFVPVAALQEIRKELQALRQAPQQPAPDPYEDFEGYQAHAEAQRHTERLGWSQRLAVVQHGEELTNTVLEWAYARADQDPMFNQRALQNPDPVGFAVQEYQREQALEMLSKPELLQAFQAWQTQTQTQTPQQPQAITAPAPIPHQQPTPPRSLASAPAAGGIKPGEIPVGPSVAFDSVFKD